MSFAASVSSASNVARRAIPKNKFKVADEAWGPLPDYVIPAANKVVHPFYLKPNATERTLLCMSESNPKLFNGNAVLPAFVRHPVTNRSTLVESRLEFNSVKNISGWLARFQKSRDFPEVRLLSKEGMALIRKSKVDPNSLTIQELEGFLAKHPKITVEALDTELNKALIFKNTESNPIYLDEIFLYILQREGLTQSQWKVVLEILPKYVGKEVDDVNMLKLILVQWAVSADRFAAPTHQAVSQFLNIARSSTIMSNNENLLASFEDSHLSKLTELFIRANDLKASSSVLRILISRNVAPPLDIIEDFVSMVDNIPCSTSAEKAESFDRKTKLHELDVLSPVFASHLSPKLVTILLGYCIHQSEMFALLELCLKSEVAESILDACINDFIIKLGQLKKSQVDNSLNLSCLYNVLKGHYKNTLPSKNILPFIISLLTNSNFRAVLQILNEQTCENLETIIAIVESQSQYIKSFGYTEVDKQLLLEYLSNEQR